MSGIDFKIGLAGFDDCNTNVFGNDIMMKKRKVSYCHRFVGDYYSMLQHYRCNFDHSGLFRLHCAVGSFYWDDFQDYDVA